MPSINLVEATKILAACYEGIIGKKVIIEDNSVNFKWNKKNITVSLYEQPKMYVIDVHILDGGYVNNIRLSQSSVSLDVFIERALVDSRRFIENKLGKLGKPS